MRTPNQEIVVGSGMSNEFQVNIGLRQGSALSPLLFILVMELITAGISAQHNALRKIMYADDLVIVADHREELQGALEEWNDMLKKHGLKMNIDKTEVMWVEEKDIKQVKVEIYLRTGVWMWRFDAEYKQERMPGETWRG